MRQIFVGFSFFKLVFSCKGQSLVRGQVGRQKAGERLLGSLLLLPLPQDQFKSTAKQGHKI